MVGPPLSSEGKQSNAKARADRVLVVISSLGGGGAERVAIDLCRYLRDSGRSITLLTLTCDELESYSVPAGICRVRMEIRREARTPFESVRFTLTHLAAMRREMLSTAPDVVVSFLDQTNVRTVACLLGTGVPVIVSREESIRLTIQCRDAGGLRGGWRIPSLT